MASSLKATLLSPAPYHLLAWGALLGMQLYQSQIVTKLAYRHLPPAPFRNLTSRLFAVYFVLQSGLSVVVAVTSPATVTLLRSLSGRIASSPSSSAGSGTSTGGWIVSTVAPLGLVVLCATLNWRVWGPRAGITMNRKVAAAAGVKSGDDSSNDDQAAGAAVPSEGAAAAAQQELALALRAFKRAHAMAIHLNAIAMVATLWYGVAGLATRVSFA